MTSPIFPLLSDIYQLACRQKYRFDAKAQILLESLGSGFRLNRDENRETQLSQLLIKASRLTAAVDQFQRRAAGKAPLHELVVQSITFQHDMLSLPPTAKIDTEPQHVTFKDCIFEITRLTTLIYSD